MSNLCNNRSDFCKDKTKEIASKYVKTITETKQGYIFAVKRGINETTAEIVTICDADSIYPLNWLHSMELKDMIELEVG